MDLGLPDYQFNLFIASVTLEEERKAAEKKGRAHG
jgi:hypothetical protein